MEPNFECAAQNGAEPLCRETAAVLCIMAKSDTAMTALGQKRRSGDVRVTSALPLKGDIHGKVRHVSKVPNPDVAVYSITSSASATSVGGTLMPIARAVFR